MREVDPLDQFPSLQHREDAMGAYLMMFATLAMGLPLPILNLIASVIYAAINGSKSDFVRFHVLQSLYSQIAVSSLNAYAIFTVVSALFFGGTNGGFDPAWFGWLLTLGGLNLTYIVFSIVAAVQARKGQLFKFPFFGWLAMLHSYGRRAHS
jgi:uncharacterized membrane protein